MMAKFLLAQAYGQGAYGTGTYGNGVISVGPIKIPATGATFWTILGIAALSAAIGLFVWARRRSRRLEYSE